VNDCESSLTTLILKRIPCLEWDLDLRLFRGVLKDFVASFVASFGHGPSAATMIGFKQLEFFDHTLPEIRMGVRSQSVPSFVPSLFPVSVHKNGRQSALFPVFYVFEAVSQVGSESNHITFYQHGTEGTVGTRRRANHLPAKIGWERPWNTWNTPSAKQRSNAILSQGYSVDAPCAPRLLPSRRAMHGRPGCRRPLPSYFCAISRRCQGNSVFGATIVANLGLKPAVRPLDYGAVTQRVTAVLQCVQQEFR
jgi:hypothetical protein